MIQPIATTDKEKSPPPTNDELAEKLETVSEILSAQGANRFRAAAGSIPSAAPDS